MSFRSSAPRRAAEGSDFETHLQYKGAIVNFHRGGNKFAPRAAASVSAINPWAMDHWEEEKRNKSEEFKEIKDLKAKIQELIKILSKRDGSREVKEEEEEMRKWWEDYLNGSWDQLWEEEDREKEDRWWAQQERAKPKENKKKSPNPNPNPNPKLPARTRGK